MSTVAIPSDPVWKERSYNFISSHLSTRLRTSKTWSCTCYAASKSDLQLINALLMLMSFDHAVECSWFRLAAIWLRPLPGRSSIRVCS
eukprot:1668381-Amphidinium_carterae.1